MSLDTTRMGGPYATVFDVGAFRGDFARAALLAWPDATVHSFEPLEPEPDGLPEAVVWHALALGSKTETREINACEFIPSSSFLEMAELHKDAFPYTRENEPAAVEVVRLSEFDHLIVEPALLKIDVQGFELEVLRGGLPGSLYRFGAVALEVNHAEVYHGAPTETQIANFLVWAGFRYGDHLDELFHPRTKQLLQTDQVWFSRWSRP